ncbi:MAG: hypothetical protein GXY77_04605 [Fibrobacter sp.]|nr:hypothetical protein [Fibrobacter sp.]
MKNYDKSGIETMDSSTTVYSVGDSVSLDLEPGMPYLNYFVFSTTG